MVGSLETGRLSGPRRITQHSRFTHPASRPDRDWTSACPPEPARPGTEPVLAHKGGKELNRSEPGEVADWIVKVGGSLLESPGLASGLDGWCRWLLQRGQPPHSPEARQSLYQSLYQSPQGPQGSQELCPPQLPPSIGVLVGGGRAADVVRQWDASHRLPARASHRLALAAMSQTARLVAELTQWPLHHLQSTGLPPRHGDRPPRDGDRPPRDRQPRDRQPWVIDLAEAAGRDPNLPESWDLTSDSLALWLANCVGARHLLLLKAVAPLEPSLKIARICELGWVDAYFSRMWTAAPALSVEIAHFHQWPQTTQVSRS